MKKYVVTLLAVSFSLIGWTQGKFSFTEESYDFGTVIEGVKATHVFKFTNTGDAPIVISGVRASCGCTTPEWPKDPIAPGGEGEIKAIYNSQGRLNAFNKSIHITSNASEASKTLFIKGNVIPEPPKVYTEEEKAMSPKIAIERMEYNFGKVQQGEKINKTVVIQNNGKQPLKIEEVKSGCYCVAVLKSAGDIAPGETGELTLAYAPKGSNQQVDKVVIKTNDITQPEFEITFKANVVETIEGGGMMSPSSSPFK